MKLSTCLLLLANLVQSKHTAGDSIRYISRSELKDSPVMTNSTYLMLFFGAAWCGYTKRFNPEYYKGQELVKKDSQISAQDFQMFKVDVTETNDRRWAASTYGVDGFPTTFLFKKGEKVEEYEGRDGTHLYCYIKKLLDQSSDKC